MKAQIIDLKLYKVAKARGITYRTLIREHSHISFQDLTMAHLKDIGDKVVIRG